MGTTAAPGYDGINYRYGSDDLVKTMGTMCTKNVKGWNWVHQTSSQKRSHDDEEIESTPHPRLAKLHALGNILKEEIAKGRSHEEALTALATAQCEKAAKLPLNKKTLDWIRMNNLHISDFDTLCDKPSERLTQESVKEDHDQSTNSLNGSFVPLWVIISASIGTAIVLIAIVVLIIIYMRKKSEANSEYSYAEMK